MQKLKEIGRTGTWVQRDELFKEFTDFIFSDLQRSTTPSAAMR
jgi:hypothetical protein